MINEVCPILNLSFNIANMSRSEDDSSSSSEDEEIAVDEEKVQEFENKVLAC